MRHQEREEVELVVDVEGQEVDEVEQKPQYIVLEGRKFPITDALPTQRLTRP